MNSTRTQRSGAHGPASLLQVAARPPAPAPHACDVAAVFDYLLAHLPLLRARAPGERAADKAACEIALLCWGVARHAPAWSSLQSTAAPLLEWAGARLRGPAVLEAMLWQPARLPMLALGDGFLRALGTAAPAFDRAAAGVHAGGFDALCERSPYQALEVAFSAGLRGAAPADAAPHWCGQSPFLPLLAVDDGYAFTHALFYLGAFGQTPLPPQYPPQAVHDAIESGLWWCLWRRDLDLLAEMLLCALFSDMPITTAVHTGIAVLRACWRWHGHLSAWENLPHTDDAATRFFQRYHPLLVAALLESELSRRAVRLDGAAADPALQAVADADAGERLGIHACRERLESLLEESCAAALAACYGSGLLRQLGATPTPRTQDWRIVRGFVERDAWMVSAGAMAQLREGQTSACTRHALRWLATLEPVAAALRG